MSRFYDHQSWRRCRRTYLRSHPLCALCQADGRRRIATQVAQCPTSPAGGLWEDWDHLHALCERHYVTQVLSTVPRCLQRPGQRHRGGRP